MSDPIINSPASPEVSTHSTTPIPQKTTKSSGGLKFKLTLAMLLVLASAGTASYLAYQRGMVNAYLPQMLQKSTAESISMVQAPPTPTAPNADKAIDNTLTAPTPVTPNSESNSASANNGTNPPAAQTPATEPPPPVVSATPNLNAPAQAAAPTAPPTAPSVQSLNNASTHALLITMDAASQWQTMQYDFNQRWDTASALQTTQTLKNQLQALNNSALLPTLSALNQVEGQIQAWHNLNPQIHLNALQQSLADMDKLHIRTLQEPEQNVHETGLWARFIATLKSVFAIKRVNTSQEVALEAANAAIVKQGISANLMSAQWAARSGQWQTAQEQVRLADASIQKYGQGYTLDALKPLMNASNFPAMPDFNSVNQALAQARAQLVAQTQGEAQTTPAPAPVQPKPQPNTPAPGGTTL